MHRMHGLRTRATNLREGDTFITMSRRIALAAFLLLSIASRALAHPEGFSGLRVQVLGDRVHAALTIHTRDTSDWFPPGKFLDYVPQVSRALAGMPDELIEIAYNEQPVTSTH